MADYRIPFTEDRDGLQYRARSIAFDYIKARLEKTDTHVTFSLDEVYVVWFAKALQNWKALISTTLPDGMYYELTYNGNKRETYLDAYKKFDNVAIPDEGDGPAFDKNVLYVVKPTDTAVGLTPEVFQEKFDDWQQQVEPNRSDYNPVIDSVGYHCTIPDCQDDHDHA